MADAGRHYGAPPKLLVELRGAKGGESKGEGWEKRRIEKERKEGNTGSFAFICNF